MERKHNSQAFTPEDIKTFPANISLEDYCKHFFDYDVIDSDTIYNLQQELISRLSEKDKKDFYKYIYRNGKKMRKPSVWVKIFKCLPLLTLFTFSDSPELHRLEKRYQKGDTSVLELTL